MTTTVYNPLLTDAEISQRIAEYEEALCASIAARQPEQHVSLLLHRDGTERLMRGGSPDDLPLLFGGCPCACGEACTCGAGWIAPSTVTLKRRPIDPPWFWHAVLLTWWGVALLGAVLWGWLR